MQVSYIGVIHMQYIKNLSNNISEKAKAFFTVARRNTMSSIFEKAGLGLGLGFVFKNGYDIDIYYLIIITLLIITSVLLSTDKEK